MTGTSSGPGAAAAERTRIVEETDARQLPALIDEWWDAPDHRRWIARALRIDLALLTERPELVIPCLHRRCAWPGAPEEAAFYVERTRVPPEAAALREAMRGWRPGAPWLRSLRPPPVPLDAGVVEEYRTAVAGELAFSADGALIGVIGGLGAVAWERATGRRSAASARNFGEGRRAPRWRKDVSTWGALVFSDEERRVGIELARGENSLGSWEVAPGLVLIELYNDDLDHLRALVDVGAGRVVWRSYGRCSAAAAMPSGDTIAVGSADGIDMLSLATGEVYISWASPAVGALAVSPDGLVASRSGSVIRVWRPAVAGARVCALAGTSGWTSAELSVDGARLVTGTLLCDGRTGALVARMDVNSPDGWLAGGPPRRCQRLTTTAFAEIMPSGLTLWDARDGAPIVRDEERKARFGDVVAFDAIGRHHAIARENGRLRVYRLRGGALVYSRDATQVEALGFSPRGEQLWWETEAGERWVVELPADGRPVDEAPTARRLADGAPLPAEPTPIQVAVSDGLLVAGGAIIPCDDPAVVTSLDGRYFASRTSHYALEDQ
jgi:hypothetical protein